MQEELQVTLTFRVGVRPHPKSSQVYIYLGSENQILLTILRRKDGQWTTKLAGLEKAGSVEAIARYALVKYIEGRLGYGIAVERSE